MGLEPITAASVELGVIGFMNAAFGLRFAPAFFAGFLAAAFFIGFLAAGFLAAGFFAAFLPFFAAIDASSNLLVTLILVLFIPPRGRDGERMHKAKTSCQWFSLGKRAFLHLRTISATALFEHCLR
jgi:hypothetical protein